ADNGYNATVKRLGIPDYFVEQGTQEELIAECAFDVNGIVKAVKEMIDSPCSSVLSSSSSMKTKTYNKYH
nr:hypothetical protein [Bacteroidales bacterium]